MIYLRINSNHADHPCDSSTYSFIIRSREGEPMQNSKWVVAEHVLQVFVAATMLLTLALVLLGPHLTSAIS